MAALELIKYNTDNGKFEVGSAATKVLRNTHGPISVVAVCGRARQGKSFILNQLLQVNAGFQIGSTHRPCTKGLWMWSSPLPRVDKDNNPFHMVGVLCTLITNTTCHSANHSHNPELSQVLLDTEGIDSYDQVGT